MKKNILVKGIVTSIVALSSVAFANHAESVKKECANYTKAEQEDANSGINNYLRRTYGLTCVDAAHSAKKAEVESAFGAKQKLSLSQCVDLLNDRCEGLLKYPWKVSDMYPDAKCEVLNDKVGRNDVLVFYSTSYDTISAFPLSASNQKCGQLQMKAPRLTSVAKFGEKVAFVVGGALFELHNVTTPSGTGTLVVNEIKSKEKKSSYSTIQKVEESVYEDKFMAIRNNGQVITIDKDVLTPSSGRLTRVGNANVERARDLQVTLVSQ